MNTHTHLCDSMFSTISCVGCSGCSRHPRYTRSSFTKEVSPKGAPTLLALLERVHSPFNSSLQVEWVLSMDELLPASLRRRLVVGKHIIFPNRKVNICEKLLRAVPKPPENLMVFVSPSAVSVLLCVRMTLLLVCMTLLLVCMTLLLVCMTLLLVCMTLLLVCTTLLLVCMTWPFHPLLLN